MSLHEHVSEQAQRVDRRPTEPQKQAGNYRKGHVKIHGLDISIENPRGSWRSGTDAKTGKPWRAQLPHHYGDIKRTIGGDSDNVDCFIGPHLKSPHVFVIDQHHLAGGKAFDEHKCFIGFGSDKQARSAYHRAFSDGKGKDRIGHIETMTIDDFKDWLRDGDTTSAVKHRAEGGRVHMADGGVPVTDPDVLSQLNAPAPVTDPALLAQLNAPTEPQGPDQGALHALGHGAAAGATFNFSDELAGVNAAAPKIPGTNMDIPDTVGPVPARMMAGAARLAKGYLMGNDPEATDAYTKARDEERQAQESAKAHHPYVYGAGEIAGAIPTMAVMPELGAVKGAGTAANVTRGMIGGAGYGGLSGLGEGTDAESRMENAGKGIIGGTVLGAGAGALGSGAEALVGKFSKTKPVGVVKQPDTEDFFDAATSNYSNMRAFGVEINPKAMNQVADNIKTELLTEGYRPRNAPKVFDAVEELRTPAGQNHEISDIDSVRKVLGKARLDPSERDAARRAVGHIDDYLANLGKNPQDVVVNPQFAGRVAEEAQAARGNYAVGKRAEDIDEALDQAERQAARSGSGGNINNAIRQRLSSLRNNKRKMSGWSDDEKTALDAVINGTKGGNVARQMGKFAPHGIVSTAMSAGAGHILLPGIGEIAVPLAGMIAKKVGDRMTKVGAENLQNVIKARSPLGKQTSINAAAQSAIANPRPPLALPRPARAALMSPVAGVGGAPYFQPRFLQGPMPASANQEQPQPPRGINQ